jgi:hypothetical protein
MLLVATPALADEYEGWEEIRPALVDGEGNEFVTPVGAGQESAGYWIGWVAEQAQTPGNWVVDTVETWTASDQMFTKLQGDCEDWAILLCALLRFHTPDGGVPADRVWISVNLVTAPGLGVVAAHAWVGFKLERGGLVYIEFQRRVGQGRRPVPGRTALLMVLSTYRSGKSSLLVAPLRYAEKGFLDGK